MSSNQPVFVGSAYSGHDGGSEGGRVSSIRLLSTLMLYAIPLLSQLRAGGYRGRLTAEPAQEQGNWVLAVTYDGEEAPPIPERWHGHRVVAVRAPARDA